MPRPRGDIKDRILRAARAEFLRVGVDGAALRAMAREAGTNIGMVYYYFPTKEDLFLAVVEETYDALLARLSLALSPEHSFEARVERLYTFIGEVSSAELEVVQLMAREALASSERLDRLFERFLRGHLPLIAGLVMAGRAEHRLDPTLPPTVILACLGGIGLFSQLVMRLVGPRLSAAPELAAALTAGFPTATEDALPALLTRLFLRAAGAATEAVPTRENPR